MGSADRLFNRQTSLDQILGEGLVADVMLWRNKNLTAGILGVVMAAWLVFERSGYTLISLVSSVLLLLFTILYLWSKSAAILNRDPPPIPHLHLSEGMVQEAAAITGIYLNTLLSTCQDIASGKDSRMFAKLAVCLLILSIFGGFIDLASSIYISVVIILSIPVLYEKYKDQIHRYSLVTINKLKNLCNQIDSEFMIKVQSWIIEQKKLS